jgi:lipopolysaccharide/colanic/teichoic acid biosynthesis glycosyltransferase
MRVQPDSFANGAGKRAMDILGSLVGLALLSPIVMFAAAAIRLTTGGPAFFAQERTGRGGRPFRVYKLRTMSGVPAFRAGRETQAGDPRITPVGRWLRRTGVDELPQLLNVLRGEMSLVGPRPLLAWENDLCDARQAVRLLVRPGITGLAQVCGRNAIPWEDRVAQDVSYVERACLVLDLDILLRTLPVALLGLDAYGGEEKTAKRGAFPLIGGLLDLSSDSP